MDARLQVGLLVDEPELTQELFQIQLPGWMKANNLTRFTTHSTGSVQQLGSPAEIAAAREVIREANRHDIELFEFARAVFFARLERARADRALKLRLKLKGTIEQKGKVEM